MNSFESVQKMVNIPTRCFESFSAEELAQSDATFFVMAITILVPREEYFTVSAYIKSISALAHFFEEVNDRIEFVDFDFWENPCRGKKVSVFRDKLALGLPPKRAALCYLVLARFFDV
jgi:elongation factor P hydroxylase